MDKRASGESADPKSAQVSRRRFVGYLIAAPTLAVGVKLGDAALSAEQAAALPTPTPQLQEVYDLSDLILDSTRPTANLITVVVNEDGTVSFSMPREEAGQGVTTMAAMLIAEEMDIPLEDVRVDLADARPELVFNQQTQASATVISMFTPIRQAAALARGRLIEAAAIQVGDDATTMRTRAGEVITRTGSGIPFADLATEAANTETREALAELKPDSEFTLIGTDQRRDDVVDAVTGRKTYTTDMDFPEALPMMIARPPTIKGTVESVNNADEVRNMPGMTDVETISLNAAPELGVESSGVAVRGRTFGQCIDAVRALDVTWGPGTVDDESDETVLEQLRDGAAPFNTPSVSPLEETAGEAPLATEELDALGPLDAIEEEFVFYWRTNAALEPNVAIADVREDSAEIWTPSQTPIVVQSQVANVLGMSAEQVTVHVTRGGGAFGRRLFSEAPLEAARMSQQIGKPTRLMWHRADEARAGRVHPMCISRVRAVFSESESRVVSFEQRHTSAATDYTQSLGDMVSSQAAQAPFANELTLSQTVFFLTVSVPYDFGGIVLSYNEIFDFDTFNTGSVRQLNNMDVRPAQELMVDRLAGRMNEDPLDFRLDRVQDTRTRSVLETVRDEAEWGRDLPDGVAQGVAIHEEYKGVMAIIAEVDARPETVNRQIPGATTGPRVQRVTMAVDVGLPINPLGLRAQMEGGIMSGIALAFTRSQHLEDGNFLEASWDDYRYTRHWNAPPELNIVVMPPNGEQVGGAGEFAVATTMAAVATAYSRAIGEMPTEFPISHLEGIPFDVKSFEPPVPEPPTDGLTAYPVPSEASGTLNPGPG